MTLDRDFKANVSGPLPSLDTSHEAKSLSAALHTLEELRESIRVLQVGRSRAKESQAAAVKSLMDRHAEILSLLAEAESETAEAREILAHLVRRFEARWQLVRERTAAASEAARHLAAIINERG